MEQTSIWRPVLIIATTLLATVACGDTVGPTDSEDLCTSDARDTVRGCPEAASNGLPRVMENVIPPFVENRNLTLSNATDSSITLNWELAIDEIDPQELLRYTVYQSEQAVLSSVSEMESSGTVVISDLRNTRSIDISDLDASKNYYFNIVVADLDNNKSAYSIVTDEEVRANANSSEGSSSAGSGGGGASSAASDATDPGSLDTDGDGYPDSTDQCNGADDALIGTRYKDADGDGLVVVSASSTLCPNDPTYTISASDVTADQLDFLDSDDSTAVTSHTEVTTTEQELGEDFDRNTVTNETYTIYVISSPFQWLSYVTACSNGANVNCFRDAMIIADLDFADVDGTTGDRVTGDGQYTPDHVNKILAGAASSSTYYFRSVVDGRGNRMLNFNGDFSAEAGVQKGCGINTVCNNVGGVVGTCYDCIVRDLTFSGNVIGGSGVGGLIGYVARQTTLSSLTFSGTISATGGKVGGIIGETLNSVVLSSGAVSGTISSTSGDSVGGIVGYAFEGAQIKQARNTASVTGAGNEVGGIVGYMADDPGEDSSVTESYNTGSVSGSSRVGGIAGEVGDGSTVTDNYNLGTVTSSQADTGGIVGSLTDGTAHRNYNAASVLNTNSNAGEGVIGSISSATSNNNYYLTGKTDSDGDGDIDGSDADTDEGSPNATVLSAANLKKEVSFTNFNFGTCSNGSYVTKTTCEANSETWTQIWEISEDSSYPYLFNNVQSPLPGN